MKTEIKNQKNEITVDFISRQGGILTLKIDGKEREFLVDKEIVHYLCYSSSLGKVGDLSSRDASLTEIAIRYGTYGRELHFGGRFKYFSGWRGLEYVRFIKEVKE